MDKLITLELNMDNTSLMQYTTKTILKTKIAQPFSMIPEYARVVVIKEWWHFSRNRIYYLNITVPGPGFSNVLTTNFGR